MPGRKLRVAIAGLGRMGARHALHFYNLTPRAEVVAVTTPDPKELEWAARNLEGVRRYSDYDEMLKAEKDIEAVVIASATVVHADQAIKAINLGLHVLCEKPLSTSPEVVSRLSLQRVVHALITVLCAVTIRSFGVSGFEKKVSLSKSHLRLLPPI